MSSLTGSTTSLVAPLEALHLPPGREGSLIRIAANVCTYIPQREGVWDLAHARMPRAPESEMTCVRVHFYFSCRDPEISTSTPSPRGEVGAVQNVLAAKERLTCRLAAQRFGLNPSF